MTITIRVPGIRSVVIAALGIVVGVTLVGPASARPTGGGVAPSAVQTRAVSCAGLTFQPVEIDTKSYHVLGLLYRFGPLGDGYFFCDPKLPHRATVTKVRFTVNDHVANGRAQNCALVRHPLAAARAATLEVLAAVPDTSDAGIPGTVRLTDTSIDFATVNNISHAYFLQCQLTADSVGLFGADVTYTIDSANG